MSVAAKHAGYRGVSKSRIAKEIYAHAVCYYASSTAYIAGRIEGIGGVAVAAVCAYLKRHASPVNVGGDPAGRVKVYNAIWKYL